MAQFYKKTKASTCLVNKADLECIDFGETHFPVADALSQSFLEWWTID